MADFLPDQNTESANAPELPVPDTDRVESISGTYPGVLVNGTFWYWDEKMTDASIALRKARDSVQKFINGFVVIVAAFGLVWFVISIVLADAIGVLTGDFWTQPNGGLFGLFVSLLAAQFLFYRRADARSKQVRLPILGADAVIETTEIASLDAVERKENIASALSVEARQAVEEAFALAKKSGHAEVMSLHIFAGSITTKPVGMLFVRLGITFDQIKDPIRRKMNTFPSGKTQFGANAQEIFARATHNSLQNARPAVSPVELFVESYNADEFIQELLYSVGVEREELENVVAWIRINEKLRERYEAFRKAASFKPKKGMNRAYTAVSTPFLDRVSEDLTRAAALGRLPLLIDRQKEVHDLLRSIEGGRQSVVLVGPPGVGKRSIIHGLAELMAAEQVPEILQDKRLVRIDVPVIVSSQGGAGAEERLLYALQEVGASGNIILVIEDIDQLVGESSGGVNLASVLAGELDKGYTFVIATTTPQAYTGGVEGSVLAQRIQKINVGEPARNDAIQVLESKIGGIENKNQVVFTYEALAALVDLSDRYMHESYLPEKAIKLAEEVALDVKKSSSEPWPRVDKQRVAKIVSDKTNIPVTEVTREEGQKLLELEERIHERVIGQDEAVDAVASALRRARAELRAENRPIANFLFLGPTGVGKTELAKATAEVYFGSEEAMLRFDMSEYQDVSSIYRLIGGPGEGGLLTEAVRKNPFSLLLLDELEKAHPDILNLFLQVMDDGRLTDGAGRTIDFTNVILIATSNAGTQYIQDAVAEGTPIEEIKTRLVEEELKQIYRPEFLNRFDGIMVFKPLSEEDVVAIAYLMMNKVADRLKAKGMTLRASDEAIHELAKRGYDPKFGARPLRRVIQETVDNAIANIMLKGEVGRRDVLVLEPGGEVRIEKAAAL